jgi:hypothetical protein
LSCIPIVPLLIGYFILNHTCWLAFPGLFIFLLISCFFYYVLFSGLVAVQQTFLLLRAEDHKWQWPIFKMGMCTGTFFFCVFSLVMLHVSWCEIIIIVIIINFLICFQILKVFAYDCSSPSFLVNMCVKFLCSLDLHWDRIFYF